MQLDTLFSFLCTLDYSNSFRGIIITLYIVEVFIKVTENANKRKDVYTQKINMRHSLMQLRHFRPVSLLFSRGELIIFIVTLF